MNPTDNLYYDSNTQSAMMFYALFGIWTDRHEPQWVDEILARVGELDQPNEVIEDVLTLMTGFMIIVARQEIARN